jgi:hypothetical protein
MLVFFRLHHSRRGFKLDSSPREFMKRRIYLLIIIGLLAVLHHATAQTWTQATTPPSGAGGWSVASSADGTKLVSVVYNGSIYVSTNSGAAWTNTTAPNLSWAGVASSADGTKLVAVAANVAGIFTSTDSGKTWISNSAPNLDWFSVASSADGNKLWWLWQKFLPPAIVAQFIFQAIQATLGH